ncbi:hypothetical protein ABFS82_07G083300 [Erythranthe guttata]
MQCNCVGRSFIYFSPVLVLSLVLLFSHLSFLDESAASLSKAPAPPPRGHNWAEPVELVAIRRALDHKLNFEYHELSIAKALLIALPDPPPLRLCLSSQLGCVPGQRKIII